MRALRWILLPLVVTGCAVVTFLLFLRIHSYVEDTCAARYGLDFPLCPAPWAPTVFSILFCVGSIMSAALCVGAAYIVAPTARYQAVRVAVIVVACLTLYMLFIHRRWELLFALIAAFAADFFIRKHHLRSTPNT
jgi:hypothetical protein